MAIHYPNGSTYNWPKDNHRPKSHYNNNKLTLYGDRGMTLEQEINKSNLYYLNQDIAVIHKKPTPIQIVKVDYPKRSAAVIKEAYFQKASTTDYNGIYMGNYIDFDAKETRNLTSFPLANFHKHQVEHMRKCVHQGGICFALIKFVKTDELFLFKATDLFSYWDSQYVGGKKSIKKTIIEKLGIKINYSLNPTIPYLSAVDQLLNSKGES
ncbi:Holliday junction resolvase RecU [Apilactobacillus apisilvae]|uniref:Holliday junction resolvase RecU n=1 Tax=Apilactobacillus apisilvae TaxID=2923364 RepID=A0ABY4PHW7_9LACO|nr:Holliday junction resolvase RecU [Apilactobacillus apisilvae]UQS85364.1 Holliday junction resolvase RecU [Apilactobacillus apisilvae]